VHANRGAQADGRNRHDGQDQRLAGRALAAASTEISGAGSAGAGPQRCWHAGATTGAHAARAAPLCLLVLCKKQNFLAAAAWACILRVEGQQRVLPRVEKCTYLVHPPGAPVALNPRLGNNIVVLATLVAAAHYAAQDSERHRMCVAALSNRKRRDSGSGLRGLRKSHSVDACGLEGCEKLVWSGACRRFLRSTR
jgi:hypothetical protein